MTKILLMIILTLTSMLAAYTVTAADCDAFALRAYQLQLDRQHGIMSDWQPESAIEWDMRNNVWQHPQFKGEKKRSARAKLFADDWKQACLAGWYQ